MKTVGSRIRHARTQKGLTIDELATRSKISKSFLWDVENGRSDIGGERLLRIANVLGASLEFLLRGTDPPADFMIRSIEIPAQLNDFAQEQGLTYRQTLALIETHCSILARRSSKQKRVMTKDDWKAMWEGLRVFLEDEK